MILDCYNALKRIEQRPAMYTGDHSLKSISIYLQGYDMALRDHKLVERSEQDSFHDWVATRLCYSSSIAGWENMILAFSLGYKPTEIDWNKFLERSVTIEEHNKSVKLFYELLEEFKKEMEA